VKRDAGPRQRMLLARLVPGGPGLVLGATVDALVERGWVHIEDGIAWLTHAGQQQLNREQDPS